MIDHHSFYKSRLYSYDSVKFIYRGRKSYFESSWFLKLSSNYRDGVRIDYYRIHGNKKPLFNELRNVKYVFFLKNICRERR